MAVTKILKTFLIILVALVGKVWAASKGKAMILLNYYTQDGDGGDQIYDNSKKEEVDVIEPMLFVDYQIDKETNVSLHGVFDTWTAASDTKLDGNTGASGKGIEGQSRGGGRLSYSKDKKTWAWSGSLGASSEYDYRSLNFGGTLEGRFAEENFVLSLSPQLYLDQAKEFDIKNGKTTDFKGRTIGSMDISASQLLTASDIIQFGYTFIHMNGSLNNISNSVKVTSNPYGNAFSRVEEKNPSQRVRHAFGSKFIHGFSDELAAHISYRYYTDDWGIEAHTAEVGLRFSFMDDDAFLMPSYRYYDQTKADFYKTSFSTVETHMTSDSDLASFTSHRVGVHYSQLLKENFESISWLEDFGMTLGSYYYTRSNDLDYVIVQAGVYSNF